MAGRDYAATTDVHGEHLTDARRRKETALAGLRELDLRTRKGELAERQAVEKAMFQTYRRVRDGFLKLPDRLSGILTAEKDQHKIHAIMVKEIHQILMEVSDDTTTIPCH